MEILQVKKIASDIYEAFQRLIPQLDNTVPIPTKEKLIKIISSPSAYLFIAQDQNKIIGTFTLIVYNTPTGDYAYLEDLVVDENSRGKGIGKKLILTALKIAKDKGVKVVNLTSRPSRKTANRLYKKIGFTRRETNVFRYNI